MEENDPIRRNLQVTSIFFLLYHFGDASFSEEASATIFNLKIKHISVIFYFAWIVLIWSAIRFYQTTAQSFIRKMKIYIRDENRNIKYKVEESNTYINYACRYLMKKYKYELHVGLGGIEHSTCNFELQSYTNLKSMKNAKNIYKGNKLLTFESLNERKGDFLLLTYRTITVQTHIKREERTVKYKIIMNTELFLLILRFLLRNLTNSEIVSTHLVPWVLFSSAVITSLPKTINFLFY